MNKTNKINKIKHHSRWGSLQQLAVLSILLMAGSAFADSSKSRDQGFWGGKPGHQPQWVATWATAASFQSPFDGMPPEFNDSTLRQIVRTSVGGRGVRVWLTNEFGTAPLVIGEASVALRKNDDSIVPRSLKSLTFGGNASVTIPAGSRVVSDPVRLVVGDQSALAVSIHLPDDVTGSGSAASYHVRALQTSYIARGNQTSAVQLDDPATTVSWFYLAGVDVLTRGGLPVIAAIGDSIIDGDQVSSAEPVDENARFTDFLAKKLLRDGRAAVVNLGISGNQVTTTFIGDNLPARLNRNVLTQSGVTHVIVQGGINDIGLPGLLTAIGIPTPANSAEQIISALQQVAARVKADGLKVIGSTLSPSGSVALPGYSGPEVEAKRQAVNAWIRSSGAFDLVVDYDAVLADPDDPTVMRAELSADGLHPNTDGYRAMARAAKRALRRAGYVH